MPPTIAVHIHQLLLSLHYHFSVIVSPHLLFRDQIVPSFFSELFAHPLANLLQRVRNDCLVYFVQYFPQLDPRNKSVKQMDSI